VHLLMYELCRYQNARYNWKNYICIYLHAPFLNLNPTLLLHHTALHLRLFMTPCSLITQSNPDIGPLVVAPPLLKAYQSIWTEIPCCTNIIFDLLAPQQTEAPIWQIDHNSSIFRWRQYAVFSRILVPEYTTS